MVEIVPGILEKDWNEIERKIEIAKAFAKSLHIDFLDGKFAPNTTFLDPLPFKKYSEQFLLEAHLMVEDPINYLEPLARAGFKRFIGHIEKMPDQNAFVVEAKKFGEVGLAIDGPTPLENLKVPLSDLDCVLIMTIKAGWSGQKFNPEYLDKVRILRPSFAKASADKQVQIEIDGGINDETIIQAKAAGANRFVSSSCIFGSQNPQEKCDLLRSIVGPA